VPAKTKQETPTGRARLPEGKQQMLVIIDEKVIKAMKVAVAEDGTKVSHVAEKLFREWLEKRKSKSSRS
jgi:hypothetical protein